MKVLVRLILLAGAAAVIALCLRDMLATHVAKVLLRPTRELAALAPSPVRGAAKAAPPAILPMLSASTAPHVPVVPSLPPKNASAAPLKSKTAAAAKSLVVTRKQVEDAIATRLSGARAVLAKGEDGKPYGLRLSGVGALAPFGVRDGDVLIAANGMPLRTSDEALAALGALKEAKHVVVSFRRGDASYAVPIDLDDAP